MKVDAKLTEARASEECGCPEEEWLINHLEVIIHIVPDGTGDIIIDAGDWEQQITVQCAGIEDLRQKAFAHIASLPEEA